MGVSRLQIRCLWTSLAISVVLGGDWVVHVPESPIQVLRGSSVTVPCTYNFPEEPTQGMPHKVLSEMWCRNQSFCITPTYVYHSNGIFPDPGYQGRVQYLGTTGSKKCSFRLTDLRTSDSGVYVFRFITDHPVEKLPGQRGLTLQVTDPPVNTLEIAKSSEKIVEGTSLILTCTSSASPPMKDFSWFKTSGAKTLFKGSGQKLIIESISVEDSGLYTCKAKNHWASVSAAIQINVHKDDHSVSITGVVLGVLLTLITIAVVAVCVRRHKRSGSLRTTNGDSTF